MRWPNTSRRSSTGAPRTSRAPICSPACSAIICSRSIVGAGLDPDNLPASDPTRMNFTSGANAPAKAWRDIWGSGQGIGAVTSVVPTRELVARLAREYAEAKAKIAA